MAENRIDLSRKLTERKLDFVKKFIYLLLIVAFTAAVLAGCGSKAKSMTAVETVQKFFNYWNNKDQDGLQSLEYEKMPKAEWQFDLLNSVTLNNCDERKYSNKRDWPSYGYPNPYDFTCVVAQFTVDAKEGSALGNQTYDWEFFILRRKAKMLNG